jgi:hypothetical protein
VADEGDENWVYGATAAQIIPSLREGGSRARPGAGWDLYFFCKNRSSRRGGVGSTYIGRRGLASRNGVPVSAS